MITAAVQMAQSADAGRGALRWIRRNAIGVFGLALTAAVVLLVICAPLITRINPTAQNLNAVMLPPGSPGHLLGTDQLGSDMLSRVLYGGRAPLFIVLTSVLLASVFGVGLGLISSMRGGWFDQVASRLADIQLAIPVVLLAITVLVFTGASEWTLIPMIAMASWPTQFRVIRAQASSLRHVAFVEAASVSGGSALSVVLRHLLPNVLPIVIVNSTLSFSNGLVIESGLSFIGLGVQPPTPDWGQMVAAGQSQLGAAWWLSVCPGVALALLLLGVQLSGDWLAARLSVDGLIRNGG
jgi:peptide/nickel transport system permease protein